MPTVEAQVAHTFRRLGFGPTIDEVEAGVAAGTGAVIDDLLERPATTESDWGFPEGDDWETLERFTEVTINNMAHTSNPLQDRLAWFLAGLVVVSLNGPVDYQDQFDYEKFLRNNAFGSYKQLLRDLTVHPGMLWYLSGIHSTRWHPNENYARELMELFSLGAYHVVTDAEPYSEEDIAEISRALTGWTWNWETDTHYFEDWYWDDGQKQFLGANRGAAGVDEVIDAIVEQDAWRFFVPYRLWTELVGVEPTAGVLNDLAAHWGEQGSIKAVVRAIAERPEFLAASAMRSRAKSPLELIASAMRVLDVPDSGWFHTTWRLWQMGYTPLFCPSVSGWPSGTELLHATNLLLWSELARDMCWRDDGDDDVPPAQRCAAIRRLSSEGSPASAVDLCRRLAGLETLTDKTRNALQDYVDAGSWGFWRAAGLMNLMLLSPEFLVN